MVNRYTTLHCWLQRREGASTIVTVSHRPELQALHHRVHDMPL
jgi:hypothetical protein